MAKVEFDVAEMIEETFEKHFGITLDRLRELAEADRDGRCVVLPCKVGDTVYEPYDGRIFTWPFHGASVELHVGGGVRMMDDFGKTVFLTRELAEEALKGGTA